MPEKGQVFVWDDDIKGFGLKLTPNTKNYVCRILIKRYAIAAAGLIGTKRRIIMKFFN